MSICSPNRGHPLPDSATSNFFLKKNLTKKKFLQLDPRSGQVGPCWQLLRPSGRLLNLLLPPYLPTKIHTWFRILTSDHWLSGERDEGVRLLGEFQHHGGLPYPGDSGDGGDEVLQIGRAHV